MGVASSHESAVERAALKQDIVEDLGESALVLPELINRGLEANDRAKYLLTLIQTARAQADHPDRPVVSLRAERQAAGVLDERFDRLVGEARATGQGSYLVPGIQSVYAALVEAVGEMIVPLEIGHPGPDPLSARLQAILDGTPDLGTDRILGIDVDRMVSADRGSGDSLHLLIMDAHKALNHLQLEVATENLDGASVYGLAEEDRILVTSFMNGVQMTAPLKFDHPGLGTTATRAGNRVLIQNDIGMTQAHVVVIAIEALDVTVTYSDVHFERLVFFESLLDKFDVDWSDATRQPGRRALEEHHLVSGCYRAPDRRLLEEYLCFLGSRLVFLIDWNRARKQLGSLVKKREAIALLRWAADEGHGHRAFLQLGGEQLLYEAVELTGRVPARYGESLRDALGSGPTLDIVRFAIRCASEGLLAGRSQTLIRDEIRVELLKHLRAAHQQVIDLVAEHGSLVVETAQSLEAALARLSMKDGHGYLARAASRAVGWEHRADDLLRAIRAAASRVDGADAIVSVASTLDDAIDDLEEALFLLTLLPSDSVAVLCPILEPLSRATVFAAREHLKALEIARGLVGGEGGEDLEDFLLSVDQVARLEHEADATDRAARAGLVSQAPDFRSLHVADLISCAMENSTDELAHAAYLLRDHILTQAAGR